MSKSDIKIQAFAMKSRPDIRIFHGDWRAREHTRKPGRAKPGEKIGSSNARNIKKLNMCSKDGVDPRSFWG
jgi:hypothetical protein